MKKKGFERKFELQNSDESSNLTQNQQKKILKKKDIEKGSGKKKKRVVLKVVLGTLVIVVAGYFFANKIRTAIYNNDPPVKDPYGSEEVLDTNDKDVQVGVDGQVVFDKMSEKEKKVLKENIISLIRQDANSRNSTKIATVKDVLSISLLPFNLCEGKNQYDKYCLSILFNDGKDLYTLNYFTGKDFESNAELTKDYFLDFINFLKFDCALYSCNKMSEDGKNLKSRLGDDVQFVGDAYKGFQTSGDEYYFIPVYGTGQNSVYYSWSSPIDAYSENPMTKLYAQLFDGTEKTFENMPFVESKNLDKVYSMVENLINPNTKEEVKKSTKETNKTYRWQKENQYMKR